MRIVNTALASSYIVRWRYGRHVGRRGNAPRLFGARSISARYSVVLEAHAAQAEVVCTFRGWFRVNASSHGAHRDASGGLLAHPPAA